MTYSALSDAIPASHRTIHLKPA